MKVGSIVECVDNNIPPVVAIPKLKTPYTVSDIWESVGAVRGDASEVPHKMLCIQLEEIETGSYGYAMDCFREILPPMEIQSALDSCEPVLIELSPVTIK